MSRCALNIKIWHGRKLMCSGDAHKSLSKAQRTFVRDPEIRLFLFHRIYKRDVLIEAHTQVSLGLQDFMKTSWWISAM